MIHFLRHLLNAGMNSPRVSLLMFLGFQASACWTVADAETVIVQLDNVLIRTTHGAIYRYLLSRISGILEEN